MAFAVAVLAVVSGCFTYALLTDLLPYHLDRAGQIALLVVNLALVLSLVTAIGWRIARLMATRRSGRAERTSEVSCAVVSRPFSMDSTSDAERSSCAKGSSKIFG